MVRTFLSLRFSEVLGMALSKANRRLVVVAGAVIVFLVAVAAVAVTRQNADSPLSPSPALDQGVVEPVIQSVAYLDVAGDPNASSDRATWDQVVVLQAKPFTGGYRVCWATSRGVDCLSEPTMTLDGRFRVLVGPQDVRFFAIALPGEPEVVLRQLDRTNLGDSKYAEVPLN